MDLLGTLIIGITVGFIIGLSIGYSFNIKTINKQHIKVSKLQNKLNKNKIDLDILRASMPWLQK